MHLHLEPMHIRQIDWDSLPSAAFLPCRPNGRPSFGHPNTPICILPDLQAAGKGPTEKIRSDGILLRMSFFGLVDASLCGVPWNGHDND